MDAKVTWQENMAFLGIADRGYTLPIDGSKDVGGEARALHRSSCWPSGWRAARRWM